MPSAINSKKIRSAVIGKAEIDVLMVNLKKQDMVSFDEIRAGLSRPDLTDGAIHQSLMDAGYEVVQ